MKKTRSKEIKESAIRHKIVLGIKTLFIVGLLLFLVQKGFISVNATRQALSQWKKMILALLLIFLNTGLGIIRWQWLLEAQNIHLGLIRTTQLSLIGNFFNIALPGAVSGDFVKAFYIGKEVKGQKSKAFGTILFDRVAGLSALVLVSAGALFLGFQTYIHSALFSTIHVLMEVAAFSVIFFYGYLFLIKNHYDPLLKVLKSIESKAPKFASIARIYESLRHYHNHRMTVVKALALSILIHLIAGWTSMVFAEALGETQLSLLSVYVVVPLGLLLTAIPVAPAGVGTGNITFFYFFHLIGSERGADIFSLIALTNVLVGAIGGLVYLRFKSKEPIGTVLA